MNTIQPYLKANESGNPKGSYTNPYTEAEFDAMVEAGTWPGGYYLNSASGKVEYALPVIIVTTSMVQSNFDSWWNSSSFSSFIGFVPCVGKRQIYPYPTN